MTGLVSAVCASHSHTFSKTVVPCIRLIAGLGVDGDAHSGATVKHRSRVAQDPSQPNLRQVHLMHAELFDELAEKGFTVSAGQLGENITTRAVHLLGLPQRARLYIGPDAIIEITGLRNPCAQIDQFMPGLLAAVLDRDADGNLIRKAGIMGIVLAGGEIHAGDSIRVKLPPLPHLPLERV